MMGPLIDHISTEEACLPATNILFSKKEANNSNLIASEIFKAFCLLH